MLPLILKVVGSGLNWLTAGMPIGLKACKYFVDSTFRDKVVPAPGSVLYCDLWGAVEHSGIYVGDGKISNIVVDGLAESTVERSNAANFTSKSVMGRKIYVSCDSDGAVGHPVVAQGADSHVGERAFYGLVFRNCHQFSSKCVNYIERDAAGGSFFGGLTSLVPDETWEPTLGMLKRSARKKLGATKWRLWDWENDADLAPPPEPDWQAHFDWFRKLPLNPGSIAQIRVELAAAQEYQSEIADESIPEHIRQHLHSFEKTLSDISCQYERVKDFLAQCPGATFSYAELVACDDDFMALAKTLQNNPRIKELARKLGRSYISEEKKKQARIPQASKSEAHGTYRSDDVMRMLPSELLNLEDDTLEVLFYARLLEKNLLSYELGGSSFINGEETESRINRTGPVVACLDTSGSMQGKPLLKAKALLLAIANILEHEGRSLHVLLFGAAGEMREYSMVGQNDAAGLLVFLRHGFGGGTDFETPLLRGFEIIAIQSDYEKADMLMISDGDCRLSPAFIKTVLTHKKRLNCSIYSVLCADVRTSDEFSDEAVVL
jgi:uncharacterized protein with von Willebrand factor type A (vWA) domain